jgi:hypothetical protein
MTSGPIRTNGRQPPAGDTAFPGQAGDPLAEARLDPLAGALEPLRAAAALAAYQRGRRGLGASRPAGGPGPRPDGTGGSGAVDPCAAARESARRAASTWLGSHTTAVITPATSLSATEVGEPALVALRATYVRGSAYHRLVRVLSDRRLVVLRGGAGSGRSATGLHLLDQLCPGKVSLLAGDLDPATLGAALLEVGRGYLYEVPSAHAPILNEARLHQLSALLGARDCFCVLVVDDHPRLRESLAGYAVDAPPADARTVLARHTAAASAADPDHVRVRAAELLEVPELAGAPGEELALGEIAHRADRLVRVARGELSAAELAHQDADSCRVLATGWFAGLHDLSRGVGGEQALRTAAFRIALAVLDGLPYHLIADAGEQLAWELVVTAWPHRTPGRPPFGLDPRTRLASCRARLVTTVTELGDTTVPTEAAEFIDQDLARAVLEHVWRDQHNLRRPMVRWLQDLAADPRAAVWVRSALAAGFLCALDFPYGYDELIAPWARSPEARHRLFAAIALDQAGSDPRVLPVVRHLAAGWARGTDEACRWTAAALARFDYGRSSPVRALEELRVIGARPAPADAPARQVASLSVAYLFAGGASATVLERIADWWDDRSPELRAFAALSVIRLADLRVWHAPDQKAAWPGRERWPLLLAHANAEPSMAERIAAPLRRVLGDPRSWPAASAALAGWVRAIADDPSGEAALGTFLRSLGTTEPEARSVRRLLEDLGRELVEPVDAGLLDRLRRALGDTASTPLAAATHAGEGHR